MDHESWSDRLYCRHSSASILRAHSCELHVERFEEGIAGVGDPDVIRQVHQEQSPWDQGRESPEEHLSPHGPVQWDVAHSQGCSRSFGERKTTCFYLQNKIEV